MRYCPLAEAGYKAGPLANKYDSAVSTSCYEECAWYDGKQCAILSIMKALQSVAEGMRK